MTPKPIVWTIAGSDSGGGAGIQADLHTFQALGAYGCSIITALTAQNSVTVKAIQYASKEIIYDQWEVLSRDLPARAIKIGMLGNLEVMQTLLPLLKKFSGKIVLDPVMVATNGAMLLEENAKTFFIEHLIPLATLLTPNLHEASALLDRPVQTTDEIRSAARDLYTMGCKHVLIKGGHNLQTEASDYWFDGKTGVWIVQNRHQHPHTHGSGCTLSSAIAAALARGFSLADALIIAKTYVTQGIRQAQPYGEGPGPVMQMSWPKNLQDFPWVVLDEEQPKCSFNEVPRLKAPIGFYPIVDSTHWVERLLHAGARTLQLRIKNLMGAPLEEEIKNSIQLTQRFDAQLFINDHWELAIKHQAYGVHLGQEDLCHANLQKISESGLRLGISTHNYFEVARALTFNPSYIACGPIFPTTSKPMKDSPQGIDILAYWCKTLAPYPVVAIGGMRLETCEAALNAGADGIAMISAITSSSNPEAETGKWLHRFCEKKNQ